MKSPVETRLAKLERRNTVMTVLLGTVLTLGVALGFVPAGPNDLQVDKLTCSQIVVKSQGSPYTIFLHPMKTIAGVWVQHSDLKKPQVAIYNEDAQGAVVGVWGDHHKKGMTGLDACLSSGGNWQPDNVGRLQMSDKNGDVKSLTVEDVKNQK